MNSKENVGTPKKVRTWNHLAKEKRRPSEYAIVSTNLHFSTNVPECPWELDPDIPINQWFRKYREGSPLVHKNWDAFRDPDEIVYRTYNIQQDANENYVEGLLRDFEARSHDEGLKDEWLATLGRLYTPSRYILHALQMGAAYIVQMAPASTISNCAIFQAGDELRWLSHVAYRTRELANVHNSYGYAERELERWEEDSCWQGFRELMEKVLVTFDWAESFVALNMVAKPAIDELLFKQLGTVAKQHDDNLLSLMCDSAMRDVERHRKWTRALVEFVGETDSNQAILSQWFEKWIPLSEQAVEEWCDALPIEKKAINNILDNVRSIQHALLGRI